MKNYGYIYKLTSPSGKSYIGQTRQSEPEKRWNNGRGYLKCKQDNAISRAVRKYKWKNFKKEIIWEGNIENINELNELEKKFIEEYNTLIPNGYNIDKGGKNKILSEETKRKMRESRRKMFELKGSYKKPQKFICIKCGKIVESKDKNLARARHRFENGRNLCKICKTKETMLKKYGYEYSLRVPEIIEHKRKTIIDKKYGALK